MSSKKINLWGEELSQVTFLLVVRLYRELLSHPAQSFVSELIEEYWSAQLRVSVSWLETWLTGPRGLLNNSSDSERTWFHSGSQNKFPVRSVFEDKAMFVIKKTLTVIHRRVSSQAAPHLGPINPSVSEFMWVYRSVSSLTKLLAPHHIHLQDWIKLTSQN